MAVPSEWSGTVPDNHRHVPSLGEHSADILREAGFDDDAIAALVAEGAVITSPVSRAP
jgi:crotonobetainyl-CoA:carnitine CoA-transferase CaiB-like acyl-CoA transferase